MDVWQIDLAYAGALDAFLDVLDEQEKNRAGRLRFAQHARRFVLAHAGARVVLSSYCGMGPAELAFAYSAYGKPSVANHAGLVFNLSHSGDMALCAVAGSGEIGVDVEKCRNLDGPEMVGRFFSAIEREAFESLAAARRMDGFFSGWTRKEAYIKAKGLGLSLPLDAFSVEIRPELPAILIASDYAPEDVGRFRLWDLPLADGYKAALAYCGAEAGPPGWRKSDFHKLAG